MVRRAVARHIIQQVRMRQISKHRHLSGRRALSVHALNCCNTSTAAAASLDIQHNGSTMAIEPTSDAANATAAAAAAAISALAAAMSAARTDPSTAYFSISALIANQAATRVDTKRTLHVPQDAGSDAELVLIRRIFELQQEKEHLIHMMQETS
ncbi:hypothetical protein BX667DRAFT_505918 [Coemansia mojavensis]|nr:hypothetical protein BX667DRAFT_505918 [Coemansia mojavensis]